MKIRSKLEVLSQSEIELIHKSSLEILSTVGMNVPNQEVLQICEKLGAKVDYQEEILRIPPELMKEVLKKIKEDNKEKYAAEKDKRSISAHISTQVSIVDYKTKTSRYGVRDDYLKGFKLIETLDQFPDSSAIVVPSDVPYDISDIVTFADIYKYSKKPGDTYILTPKSAKYILEINRLMGKESTYLLETISPLSYKSDTLEMALMFAKNGGHLSMGPMVMAGATGPVTPAGTMTLQNTEILGSLFIVFALTGSANHYGCSVHSTDPRTMLCSFGSANQALFGVAAAQMQEFYGIHGMTNAGLTDALQPDFQGGFEKGVTASFNFLAGCRGMGGQGIVGADQGISLEQLVIDNEWINYYNYIVKGFEVNEDTIGVDVIKSVGIKGNFLAEEHTLDYMYDSFVPSKIFTREDWNSWINSGSSSIYDRAHEYVETVTAGYKDVQPLISADLCDELDRIVKEAEKEILGK